MSHVFFATGSKNNLKKPETIRMGLEARGRRVGMNIPEKEAEGPDSSPTCGSQGSALPKGKLMMQ